MGMKKKIFRIDATLAAAFEAFCATRAIKQEQAAEASLFALLGMSPDQREAMFLDLETWKAKQADEPASGAGRDVARALKRRRASKAPAKRRPGRRSA